MSTISLHHATMILNRLKTAKDFRSDSQLARFLQKDPSTISTWRKRNSLDFTLILAKCQDINANYLFHGELPILKADMNSDEYPSPVDRAINNLSKREQFIIKSQIHELKANIEILKEVIISLKK